MWRNYLTVGLRALTKNRTYAFINIFGLAIGLAAALLLFLYVRYETSYDAWLPDAERVYQVQTFGTDPDTGADLTMQGVTRPVSDALAKDFPQIEAISKFESDEPVVLRDGQAMRIEKGFAADPTFFQIMQIPFLYGDPATALDAANSVTLSQSEATRLFGTPRAVGRTLTQLRDGEKVDLRVTGVFRDLPKNSHTEFGFVRRFNTAEEIGCGWGCVNGTAYLKLRPGIPADAVNNQMQAWERRNVPARDIGGSDIGAAHDWRIVNVRDIHLGPAQGGERPGNDMRTIVTFAVVALLILSMAIVNFVNLATARAGQRAREVALRKVLGARRRQLVAQFLGESMLLVAVAMLIALALLELTVPAFSLYLDIDLEFDYFGAGGLALPVLALAGLVGLLGGLYPALALSSYQPASILKANKSLTDAQGSGGLRNLLVVAQFAVSIGLIACTMIVYHQTVFARTADPGYQREGLLTIEGLRNSDVRKVRETLTREIAKIEGVTGVSGSKIVPADGPTFFTTVTVPGRSDPVKLGWYSVEPSFFDTMKIGVTAGRTLSPARAQDKLFIDYDNIPEEQIGPAARAIAARGMNVVLNESAARLLGFGEAAAAIGEQIGIPVYGEEIGPVPATVVGVVRDTRFRSIREQVEPIIYYDDGFYRYLVVRFEGNGNVVRERIEQAWRGLFPEVPFEASFADTALAKLYGSDEARGRTFAGFALLAIVIACLGLFGLAAFTAERRTKEIGIRKVFGATVSDIVKLLAWQFSRPVILANIIAWPVAWWLMRDWLNTFDARIALTPGPFVLAGLIALVIAIATIAGHAVKVARANPIHALRYE